MGFEGGPLRKPRVPEQVRKAVREGDTAKIIEFASRGGKATAEMNERRKIIEEHEAEKRAEEAKQMSEERGDHLIPEDDR